MLRAPAACAAWPGPVRGSVPRRRSRPCSASRTPRSFRLCATPYVLRPEDRTSDGERLFEQRLRLVVDAQPPIDPPHHRQHLGLQLGLTDELLLHPLGAGVEQPAHGRFAASVAVSRTGRRRSAGRSAARSPWRPCPPRAARGRARSRAASYRTRSTPRAARTIGRGRRHAAHVPPDELRPPDTAACPAAR